MSNTEKTIEELNIKFEEEGSRMITNKRNPVVEKEPRKKSRMVIK